MRSANFRKWQDAERAASEAARELQAVLRIPGHVPPDWMFVRVRQLRHGATEALQELMRECGQESARFSMIATQKPASRAR